MRSSAIETSLEHRRLEHQAQRRAIWDFVAAVEDLRCSVCYKRVDFDDQWSFERTSLCFNCSEAVNQDL